MKKNVLVFPCGSEIALEIYRSLKYSTHFTLIGANSVKDNGRLVFEHYVGEVPHVTEDGFIDAIQKIVKAEKIDFIYPAMDSVCVKLKEHEEELGCTVISSCLETTQICLSKEKTYCILKDIVKTPRVFSANEALAYPVFCKPPIGYSAKNTKLITDESMLHQYLKEHPESMILEYLPGEEYTVDCFTDRFGKLLFCGPRMRARISNGISVGSVSLKLTEEFLEIAEKINEKIKLRGAWFFQLKRAKDGMLTLLEVASRQGGSSSLYRARGINFAQLSLFDAMGVSVEILDNGYPVELERALDCSYAVDIHYDEVFIDWDDTIIVEGHDYNPDVMKLLYQFKNRGKKITLLSSHDGDLEAEFEHFPIRKLFDRIIHISKMENKADFIDNRHSIFIDDSFAERKRVFENKQIPVFSVDMIEVLFNG